jgi:hypothetical protein
MQQDSLEDSYSHKKDSEITFLTTLSDSTPKDRHVDVIWYGGKVKENLENKSSPRKRWYWLFGRKKSVTLKLVCKQALYVHLMLANFTVLQVSFLMWNHH